MIRYFLFISLILIPIVFGWFLGFFFIPWTLELTAKCDPGYYICQEPSK